MLLSKKIDSIVAKKRSKLLSSFRYLLKFGQVTRYLGYNALLDFFPTMSLKPNETCSDSFCVRRQKEFKVNVFILNQIVLVIITIRY